MIFHDTLSEAVQHRFHGAIFKPVPGGWLVLAPTEYAVLYGSRKNKEVTYEIHS